MPGRTGSFPSTGGTTPVPSRRGHSCLGSPAPPDRPASLSASSSACSSHSCRSCTGAAAAAPPGPPPDDTIHVGPDLNGGKHLPLDTSTSAPSGSAQRCSPRARPRSPRRAVPGDERDWLALDDTAGQIYLKTYTLRAVGENIEVWVANDLVFPEGDCRNDERVVITDEQVNRPRRRSSTATCTRRSPRRSACRRPRDGSGLHRRGRRPPRRLLER